jgi:hypothetical protein
VPLRSETDPLEAIGARQNQDVGVAMAGTEAARQAADVALDVARRATSTAAPSDGAYLIAALTVPPVRDILSLATPIPPSWTLARTGAVAAVLLNRMLASARGARHPFPALALPG